MRPGSMLTSPVIPKGLWMRSLTCFSIGLPTKPEEVLYVDRHYGLVAAMQEYPVTQCLFLKDEGLFWLPVPKHVRVCYRRYWRVAGLIAEAFYLGIELAPNAPMSDLQYVTAVSTAYRRRDAYASVKFRSGGVALPHRYALGSLLGRIPDAYGCEMVDAGTYRMGTRFTLRDPRTSLDGYLNAIAAAYRAGAGAR